MRSAEDLLVLTSDTHCELEKKRVLAAKKDVLCNKSPQNSDWKQASQVACPHVPLYHVIGPHRLTRDAHGDVMKCYEEYIIPVFSENYRR
jgi:hypothetical protein